MKKYLIPLLVISLIWGCKKEIKTDDTPKEMVTTNEDGWTNLFDGKSFDGWHTYLQDTISSQWQIEDGLKLTNACYDFSTVYFNQRVFILGGIEQ